MNTYMKKKRKNRFWVFAQESPGKLQSLPETQTPFASQQEAEEWIRQDAANTWLTSCGCLRNDAPEKWGDTFVILQEVRRVKPMPPKTVKMELEDVV